MTIKTIVTILSISLFTGFSEQEIDYTARCVQAEAGNQDSRGRAYVADCILNRYDSGEYEDLIAVINEEGQFSVVHGGNIWTEATEETRQIVIQEMLCRQDTEIKYFQAGSYHSFGEKCFQWQDHYFSK